MEEYVLDFVQKGSITAIEIVQEITGLSYDDLRNNKDYRVIKVYNNIDI